jgi:hypothetical protein
MLISPAKQPGVPHKGLSLELMFITVGGKAFKAPTNFFKLPKFILFSILLILF